ncbi:MAG: hypothetical protein AAFY60_22355, partial [Myxococcota bacterium]
MDAINKTGPIHDAGMPGGVTSDGAATSATAETAAPAGRVEFTDRVESSSGAPEFALSGDTPWISARDMTLAKSRDMRDNLERVAQTLDQVQHLGIGGELLPKAAALQEKIALTVAQREKPLTLGMIGVEKQGKSELINTLIG